MKITEKRCEKLHKLIKMNPYVIQDYELNDIECYIDFYEPENFCLLLECILDNGMDVQFNFKRNKDHKTLCNVGDIDGEDLVDALINWFEITPEYFEFEEAEVTYLNLQKDLQNTNWKQ